jgi:hypothetical protein
MIGHHRGTSHRPRTAAKLRAAASAPRALQPLFCMSPATTTMRTSSLTHAAQLHRGYCKMYAAVSATHLHTAPSMAHMTRNPGFQYVRCAFSPGMTRCTSTNTNVEAAALGAHRCGCMSSASVSSSYTTRQCAAYGPPVRVLPSTVAGMALSRRSEGPLQAFRGARTWLQSRQGWWGRPPPGAAAPSP